MTEFRIKKKNKQTCGVHLALQSSEKKLSSQS